MEIKHSYTEELLDALHEIEAAAGRRADHTLGSQNLDLDVIFMTIWCESERLSIPHTDAQA